MKEEIKDKIHTEMENSWEITLEEYEDRTEAIEYIVDDLHFDLEITHDEIIKVVRVWLEDNE